MNENENESFEKSYELLKSNIRKIMQSEEFKNSLETQGYFISRFGGNNGLAINSQLPGATYVMSKEEWARKGRGVAESAKGAVIKVPIFAGSDLTTRDAYFENLKSELSQMYVTDPSLLLAKKNLDNTNLTITLQKNGLWGVENSKAQRLLSDNDFKKFLDKNIFNMLPVTYKPLQVYDVEDTFIPQYLWLKDDFKPAEIISDSDGTPIRNDRGEYKIKNSPERISRFIEKIDIMISSQIDENKMQILFDALKNTAKVLGMTTEAVDRTLFEDNSVEVDALCLYGSRKIQYANDLSLLLRNEIILHELSHTLLHWDMDCLSLIMGIDKSDISEEMKEVQAEASAFIIAEKFGLGTDPKSYHYLANFSKSLDLYELERSSKVIEACSNILSAHIERSLIKNGYDFHLEPLPASQMDKKQVNDYALKYLESCLDRTSKYKNILSDLYSACEKAQGREKTNIEDQIRCVNKFNDELIEMRSSALKLGSQDITDRAEILEMVDFLESTMREVHKNELLYNSLLSENKSIVMETDTLINNFSKKPMDTIFELSKKYNKEKEFNQLSDIEKSYIISSPYIKDNLSYMLHRESEIPVFLESVFQRARSIDSVSEENGTFIEINSIDKWDADSRRPFTPGELCHPGYANHVIGVTEIEIRNARKTANEKSAYYPYSECNLTVYSRDDKHGNVTGFTSQLAIGDKGQTCLTDHLVQCVRGNEAIKPIYEKYRKSLKDKMWEFHIIPKIYGAGLNFENESSYSSGSVSSYLGNHIAAVNTEKQIGRGQLNRSNA